MRDLVASIASQVGVSEQQAGGGAALLLCAARDKLGAATFDQSIGTLPGMKDLLSCAPRPKGLGRLFGGVASAVGGNRAAMIATVVSGFSRLGMNTDQAQAFVPVIVDHLRGRLDAGTAARIEQLLRT